MTQSRAELKQAFDANVQSCIDAMTVLVIATPVGIFGSATPNTGLVGGLVAFCGGIAGIFALRSTARSALNAMRTSHRLAALESTGLDFEQVRDCEPERPKTVATPRPRGGPGQHGGGGM